MRILNLEQGSPEWLEARRGVLTASNFSKVITTKGKRSESRKDLILDLVSQTFLNEVQESFLSDDMQRGIDLEPLARRSYQQHSLNVVEEIGFMISDCGDYGYSPDGIIDNDGLIEIKCPKAKTHLKYVLDGKLPTKYIQQVQGGLFVSDRKWCDFVSFHPEIKLNDGIFIIRVQRDEEFIEKLAEQILSVVVEKQTIINNLKKGESK